MTAEELSRFRDKRRVGNMRLAGFLQIRSCKVSSFMQGFGNRHAEPAASPAWNLFDT